MPTYDFQHEDGEVISVKLDLKQPAAAYQRQERGGRVYKRIYEAPQFRIDANPGDATFHDYQRVTTNKNLTVNEMAKVSKDMSVKRAAREGADAVQEKHYANYEQRIGRKHKDVLRRDKVEKAKKSLKKFGVNVDLSK